MQSHIHALGLTCLEGNSRAHEFLEARRLGRDNIIADRDSVRRELSSGRRGDLADESTIGIRYCNFGSWHNGAAGVGYRADDGCGVLSPDRDRQDKQKDRDKQGDPSNSTFAR